MTLQQKPRFQRRSATVFGFVLGVGCTAAFTVALAAKKDGPYPRLDIFAKVLSHIENSYVEDVDDSKLVYGGIRGMVATIDPHSAFMDPDEYRSMKDDTSGEFSGVGFEFAQRDGAMVVLGPIEDTPAANAGLLAGDIIVAINDVLTRGLSVTDATNRLKGKPGSEVRLRLMRPGVFNSPQTITIKRAFIRVVAVDGKLLEGNIGYVRIKSFQQKTAADLKKKLAALRSETGVNFKGLVLDLRNNPGGLLDEGVATADRFLETGIIVKTRDRNGRHVETETATAVDNEPNYPIVVLINRGTASASEIVAGALQDQHRALLMGTTSFGKGSVQTIIDLDDGSALKLTIARYYTPSGRSIQERGIVPDVLVSQPAEDQDALLGESTLPGHFKPDQNAPTPIIPVAGPAVLKSVNWDSEAPSDRQLAAATAALRDWPTFVANVKAQREAQGSNTAHP